MNWMKLHVKFAVRSEGTTIRFDSDRRLWCLGTRYSGYRFTASCGFQRFRLNSDVNSGLNGKPANVCRRQWAIKGNLGQHILSLGLKTSTEEKISKKSS